MTTNTITLIKTEANDLATFFNFQLNEEASLAAFTSKDSTNRTAYIERYSTFLTDPAITMRTIKLNDEVVGSIAKFVMEGDAGIKYWIDRKFWGQGIATTALNDLLKLEPVGPVYGRVAFDNYGSQKVLEKCGFIKTGTDKGFANARQKEIGEYIYKISD